MSPRDFDAFALPAGVDAEELALVARDAHGLRVRHLDASAAWVRGVAGALRDAREALAARPAVEVAEALGRAGARFLDPDERLRAEALALLPATAGLSPEMASAVLDGMAADWTTERLARLLAAELGDAAVLDGFVDAPVGDGTRIRAVGPALCVQIVAGSVPGVGVTAVLRSLLLKGPTLLKPGRGDVVLPVLFARALREVDAELADAVAVVYWPGGERELEAAALASADVVTAYGSDETVRDVRDRTPVTARFVAYHHRVSVGVVGREALKAERVEGTAGEVAEACTLFDQRGCVSPQTVFVEGATEAVERFARSVADRLAVLEERLPHGEIDAGQASALHQLRGTAELMASSGEASVMHGGAAAWTVIVEPGGGLPGAGAGRTLRVRAVTDAEEVPALLAPLGAHLQTVGVAGLGDRLGAFAGALARVGASRVVPFASVAFPPPWWHHDGGGPLRELVRWTDLEE